MEEHERGLRSTREVWGLYLDKVAFGVAIAFFLSVFISKAAMNSLGGLLLLLGFVSIGVNRQHVFKTYPFLMLFLIPVIFGCGATLFSEIGGVKALFSLLNRLKWFVLPVILASFLKDEKRVGWIFGAVLLSGTVATLFGVSQPEQRVFGLFSGMHQIGRNADMLMICLLGIAAFLGNPVFRRSAGRVWVGIMACVAVLFFWALVMGSIRGAWLGLLVGLGVYSLLFNRTFLFVGAILIVIAVGVGPSGVVLNEFKSIGNRDSDVSNLARLELWQTGLSFSRDHMLFGSGCFRIKDQFREYYQKQPEEYHSKNFWSGQYPGDFHNSYIQLFVEGGLLFFLVFIGCGAVMLYRLLQGLGKVSREKKVYVQAAVAVSTGFLLAQFFHGELYSYGSVLFILVLFVGMAAPYWIADGRNV